MENKSKIQTGVYQWADQSINCLKGCGNECRYCYAKASSLRFKQTKSPGEWAHEQLNKTWEDDRSRHLKIKHLKGRVTFPSTHDIRPENLPIHLETISEIMTNDAVSELLIVSKPHLDCIDQICRRFPSYRHKIQFRFTIGSIDNDTLKFWEPGAPVFEERIASLKSAFDSGFRTSVSSEPMLDSYVDRVVDAVTPYVSDSIWIGIMNGLMRRLKSNGENDPSVLNEASKLLSIQNDPSFIMALFNKYRFNSLIRWKDSITDVLAGLGIEAA